MCNTVVNDIILLITLSVLAASFPQELKQTLLLRLNSFHCTYCGIVLTVDHIK